MKPMDYDHMLFSFRISTGSYIGRGSQFTHRKRKIGSELLIDKRNAYAPLKEYYRYDFASVQQRLFGIHMRYPCLVIATTSASLRRKSPLLESRQISEKMSQDSDC